MAGNATPISARWVTPARINVSGLLARTMAPPACVVTCLRAPDSTTISPGTATHGEPPLDVDRPVPGRSARDTAAGMLHGGEGGGVSSARAGTFHATAIKATIAAERLRIHHGAGFLKQRNYSVSLLLNCGLPRHAG